MGREEVKRPRSGKTGVHQRESSVRETDIFFPSCSSDLLDYHERSRTHTQSQRAKGKETKASRKRTRSTVAPFLLLTFIFLPGSRKIALLNKSKSSRPRMSGSFNPAWYIIRFRVVFLPLRVSSHLVDPISFFLVHVVQSAGQPSVVKLSQTFTPYSFGLDAWSGPPSPKKHSERKKVSFGAGGSRPFCWSAIPFSSLPCATSPLTSTSAASASFIVHPSGSLFTLSSTV